MLNDNMELILMINEIKDKVNNLQSITKTECLELVKHLLESQNFVEVIEIYKKLLGHRENILMIHPMVYQKILDIYAFDPSLIK